MKWTSSFKYLPIQYRSTLSNTAQYVAFDNNLSGERVRVLFSNAYSKFDLVLSTVTIAVMTDNKITRETALTLYGHQTIHLSPNQVIYSDAVAFPVSAGDRLLVKVSVEDTQNIESFCGFWSEDEESVRLTQAHQSLACEAVYEFIDQDSSALKGQFFFGFSAVQIETTDNVQLITAFGDSITQMSFLTHAIQKRLYAAYPGQVALINAGISGNRLVHDATWIPEAPDQGALFGSAGVKRFESDVFKYDAVNTVLFLMGINDIMHPLQFESSKCATSEHYLIQGAQYLAQVAHAHHARVIGGTILPAGHASYTSDFLSKIEASRLPFNQWVRTQEILDAYFDYDAILRQPDKPSELLSDAHVGDGLHPNATGGRLIAEEINLQLLML